MNDNNERVRKPLEKIIADGTDTWGTKKEIKNPSLNHIDITVSLGIKGRTQKHKNIYTAE
jgi:hypothetical protein